MDKKKDTTPFLVNAAAHGALQYIKLKNHLTRRCRTKKLEEDEPYAQRVCKDDYAPFVKASFRLQCKGTFPADRPMGILRKSTNMAELFRAAVKMHKNRPCMGYRPLLHTVDGTFENRPVKKVMQGGYRFESYESVDQLVDSYGKGFCQLGIKPGQAVAILAETSFDWMCIALALLRFNMPIVTLYATLSEDGIVHGLKETEVSTLVTSQDLYVKMKASLSNIDTLRNIVYIERIDRAPAEPIPGKTILTTHKLRKSGEDPGLDYRPVDPQPKDTAILMYTSGSTGVPKAVILTHENMIAATRGLGEVFDDIKVRPDDSYVAYLPLAHVFELNCEILALLYGVKIGYSSAATLTDNSPNIVPGQQGDCAILQPSIMAAVPLMLDRVKKAVIRKCSDKGAVPARVLELAVGETIRRFNAGRDATIYDKDIFSQIRSIMGGRVRLIATGSAPLSPETHAFIRAALGCVVLQGYGLTETCAAATCMDVTDLSTGGVGCPVAGAYVRLEDWKEGGYLVKENKGEIVLGGDMISAGYFKNKTLTEESFFEKEGIRWFRTGDIGEVTEKGTFKIIDRKKDLVKLQNGEYISLGKVETELKTMSVVENICAYGNSMKDYIVALVQPNMRMLSDLANQNGCVASSGNPAELTKDETLTNVVLEMIQSHAKSSGFLRKEIPVKIKLCPEEWTPDNGLVTAAMKLCRKEIQKKYQQTLDELYS